jgi:phage gp46-like protein
MPQNWSIDPTKRDYIMRGGSPEQTDSLSIPAYIRLKARRTRWMYAPNNDWGSDMYLSQRRISSTNPSELENIAARSLQPIADDGRAKLIEVESVNQLRHSAYLNIRLVKRSGEIDDFQLPGFGV